MISVEGVTRRFGGLVAVNDLTLQIPRGEVFGLLGPNGAGKSTLIAMISGLLKPSTGTLSIGGSDPTTPAAKKLIGLAPQSLAVYEELSAIDNLMFFGRLYGMNKKLLQSRIVEVLEFVGLTGREKDRVNQYSGGMKRRLNLAITLMHDPEILLLDEPTVGVDPQSRNSLFDNVAALRESGKTIVYTTHYMEEAQRLCDRVGIIDHGRLLALDSVDALIEAHCGESTLQYTTTAGSHTRKTATPVADLQTLLAGTDDIRDLKLTRPDLEQVFLNLTGRQLRD